MAIEEILVEIENLVEDSFQVPFTNVRWVNQTKMIHLVDDLRNSLPQVLQEATRIVKEKEKIIEDARKEGEKLKEQARVCAVRLIDENAIVKQAEKRAEEIIADAHRKAEEMEMSMAGYADNVLEHVEGNLQKALQVVQQAHGDFRQKYSDK